MSSDIHVVRSLIPVKMIGTLEETAKFLLEDYAADLLSDEESYADRLMTVAL